MPPPPGANATEGNEEPEYDPSEEEDDIPQFPITHEIVLKDHNKVISALALDPSGARMVSGSHDYDCKLWDFGGMDHRCKPFNTWEPAGSYHVRRLFILLFSVLKGPHHRFMTSSFRMMEPSFCAFLVQLKPGCTTGMARKCTSARCFTRG